MVFKVILLFYYDCFCDFCVVLGGCEVEVVDVGYINFIVEDEIYYVDVVICCGSV